MRDERTPKDVCGEATAPLYQERSFSLVYIQVLVEYPLSPPPTPPPALTENLTFIKGNARHPWHNKKHSSSCLDVCVLVWSLLGVSLNLSNTHVCLP